MKRIAILGSTGSIGTSTLEVVDAHPRAFQVAGLVAHRSWVALARQCQRYRPAMAVIADELLEPEVDCTQFPAETSVRFGPDAVQELVAADEVDFVMSAIVGAAGLKGTWGAIESGKTIGLANKETLVVGGPLVMELARRRGVRVIPVDSEHSAIFQALQCGGEDEVGRLILTASGGPFRQSSRSELEGVTPAMALKHPNWSMGPKISVDSATMMNKGLEVIEARWLFDVPAEKIEVVVHPQSIVHSMVEFVDGSMIAQLSPPDMKLPIQYALTFPERWAGVSPRCDFRSLSLLEFELPDLERFPALGLGLEVAARGGTCGAVLNAANEVAVARFLAGTLKFQHIARSCREVLNSHHFDPSPTLDQLLKLDQWGREETDRWNP